MRAWIAVLFVGCGAGVDPAGMETPSVATTARPSVAQPAAAGQPDDAGTAPPAVDAGTISDPSCIPGSDPRCS